MPPVITCIVCLCVWWYLQEQIRRWKERERATEMEEQQNKVQRTNDTNKGKDQVVDLVRS